ncbi:MAG: cation:proton antiporter [Candidatus Dadabacteria bacterium]|nr:cation:proton antiporter [Candidatus Dadabacteria bacterium]
MSEHLLMGLAAIIVLGIGAQWLAWRISLPAILLLLIFGFIAGPVTGLIDPNVLFGNLLLPLVSVTVAIILFEGGLSLKFSEVKEVTAVIRNLVTVGVLVSWVLTSLASYLIFGLGLQISILLGAVLVVTGPTVIIPLLRHVRPSGRVGSIIKWEGIIIDPIGAVLAVLVFEVIISVGLEKATTQVVVSIFKTLVIGTVLGLAGAKLVVVILKRHWVPDFLQNPVSLMIVVFVFVCSNVVQVESGFLSVTLMGIALANQKWVSIKHIVEFKENLRVLFISSLFIILASRLTIDELSYVLNFKGFIFLVLMILVVRPLSIFISTYFTDLNLKEKLFLSWMAPRGIVAAAVASVFALRLVEAGYEQAERIIDITFLVITGTVAIYGLTAFKVARRLGLAKPNPQGLLIVGAHIWARSIAKFLHENGFQVSLVDSNWANVSAARQEGLKAYYENILLEDISEDIELDGIGKLIALTRNDEVNSLAALHFIEDFGRSQVYQLPKLSKFSAKSEESIPQHLRGRLLFGAEATFSYLDSKFASGALLKKTPLTDEFNYDSFQSLYGEKALPLFIIKESGELVVLALDNMPTPLPGQYLISLVDNGNEDED